MLNEKQSAFLKRYVISAAPALTGNLDSMTRDDRSKKVLWARDTILNGFRHWQDRQKGIKDLDPRDQFLRFAFMDRDAKGWEKLLADTRVFQKSEDVAACEKAITRVRQQAEDGRMSLKKRVVEDAQYALDTEWPDLARRAADPKRTASRKEMLHIIEELEESMSGMRRALELAGASPAMVERFKPVIEKLRKTYDASVPTFSGKVKPVKGADETEPPLTYSEKVCEKIYEAYGNNWFALKKEYRTERFLETIRGLFDAAPKDGTEVMWQLWAYRKKVVDDLIEKATAKYEVEGKGRGWVAVGSTNLESDYDLSVMQHGKKGEDWEVVDFFNKSFQARFGTQPGIMFDTNLYASAPPIVRMSDDPKTETEIAMAAMVRSGQDMGALMKQRRFMTWEEYEDMMNDVLDSMEASGAPDEIVLATRKQFEEADSNYQLAQARILERGEAVLDQKIRELEQQEKAGSDERRGKRLKQLRELRGELDRLQSAMNGARDAELAKLMLERAERLESAEDIMLAVNNEIYVEAVHQGRKLEQDAAKLSKEIEELKSKLEHLEQKDPKSTEDDEAIKEARQDLEARQKEFEGSTARSKSLFTDAVFFANEAYHSEGPFKHVVQATQAVDSDMERAYNEKNGKNAWKALTKTQQEAITGPEMTKRRDALSLHDCLQSFNEQLGDFIKDLHHHAADKNEDLPGTGFFRSSKYLDRLIDAVDLLDKKVEGGLGVPIPGKHAKLQDYRDALGSGLLALRKGKITIETSGASPEEQQEQMEAYAIEQIRQLFGVSTLHDLGKLFKGFGSKVNAKLRAQVALEMQARKPAAYFPREKAG